MGFPVVPRSRVRLPPCALLLPILGRAALIACTHLEILQARCEASGRAGRFVGVGELVGVCVQVVEFPKSSPVLDVFPLIARADGVEILACSSVSRAQARNR